jgi:hypothetical protein
MELSHALETQYFHSPPLNIAVAGSRKDHSIVELFSFSKAHELDIIIFLSTAGPRHLKLRISLKLTLTQKNPTAEQFKVNIIVNNCSSI